VKTIKQLEAELAAAKEALEAAMMDAERHILKHSRISTHWDGCDTAHWACYVLKRIRNAIAAREVPK